MRSQQKFDRMVSIIVFWLSAGIADVLIFVNRIFGAWWMFPPILALLLTYVAIRNSQLETE